MFETDRLILRPWADSDAADLFEYAQDPRIGPRAGWPVHTNVEESRQIIRDVLSAPETYAIVWKETGRVIGDAALKFHSDLATKDDECELGYWLGAPYWGRGIMPEAAAVLIRHAFADLELSRIWCGYYDDNVQSRRVQEKCGFRYQWTTERVEVPLMHEVRTGYVSCLTREEWLANQSRGPGETA